MTQPVRDSSTRMGIGRAAGIRWFVVGVVVAFAMQWAQVQSLGGEWNSLLSTWDEGPLRPVIEEELGPVTTIGRGGHDGQVSYVVALDPLGTQHAELREDAGLRWRRILYPLVAGIGGTLGGHALLASLTIVSALGFGLSVTAWADLMSLAGFRRWTMAGALVNPGAVLGVILLTPDAVALGLALAAVAVFIRQRLGWAAVLLVLTVLTKDQYVLVPLALGAFVMMSGSIRRGLLLAAPAVTALGAWSLFVAATIGGVVETNDSIGWPFVGIARGIAGFKGLPSDEQTMLLLAYAMVLGAALVAWRTRIRLLRYLAVPWLFAAPFLSRWVWQTGNNGLRVLTPLWLVAVVGIEEWLTRRDRASAVALSDVE